MASEEVEMRSLDEEEKLRQRKKDKEGEAEQQEEVSVERAFEGLRVPPWREQLTFRALVVSFLLSVMFSVIVMKLNLTTGIIPSLNVAAGLLGFFFIKMWTKVLEQTGLLRTPFTRQENTVIQTCVVAAYGLAFSGGFGSYLFGMSSKIAGQAAEGSEPQNIKDPSLGWMIGFMFVVSFLGLFSLVPLRKIMIIDYKLIYPSGTATAYLINGFHTLNGEKLAKKQVWMLGKCFIGSFFWGFFQWFYTASDGCGFVSFPTLGLKAYDHRFYFDFSATYVGVGMICPYLVNVSVLLGGILSWGIMWPLIHNQKGHWYPADTPDSSLHGLNGYKVFIGIAMILGDGLYNFVKVLHRTVSTFVSAWRKGPSTLPVTDDDSPSPALASYDDEKRTDVFLKDQIPQWVAYAGYVAVAVISIIALPFIFPPLKWYFIFVAYIFAPVLAFCNAYGCGLTDWSLASTYGKLAIFVIGAWAGSHGGVLAALAACGVMMSIVSTASDLMQDFKTGYLTLASPRSMFVSQIIGTAMGCVIAPSVFWLFFKAFKDIGTEGSQYPAPYAIIYRNMAILGVDGFGSLPKHCLTLCYVFFVLAIVINLIRDLVGPRIARFIPIPMAMAIPFYIGSYFAIDMFIGSVILFVWEKIDKRKADSFAPAVASGVICGDGIWTLPQAVLALAQVKPPICMKFLSRKMNAQVDEFISTLS
ncbi:probable metal-nicotianamine transporter YSL12 isoform X2 [Zingiber officinale]|uniref:probable metal-nicotianamine transporter YSL12 isoform X2 n=1 Tax=Zingiber officinale TaxID=94328 RepID=UPI001C4D3052|nr:probable metal-nicotianamine transporter YSL12 isoform X2 [Zingiber officinale]XP_042373921.1 probable metal-nicotianamine transporter YSL12 isoform X2 [Zingiber officinale]